MKDAILEWLGVIKDEDLHLYEEYIPRRKKNAENSSFSAECYSSLPLDY